MNRRLGRGSLWPFLAGCALALSGCARGPETEYGSSLGKSLNGTSVFASILRGGGHEVRAAIRLTDELGEWAEGIVRFAPYPGPPDRDEAAWYVGWLAAQSDRFLIYVVRDFDATAEYWSQVLAQLPPAADPELKAQVEESARSAGDWVARLPPRASDPATDATWHNKIDVEAGWKPPRVAAWLAGPWARGIDAATAALPVHECLKKGEAKLLLAAEDKPLAIEKRVAGGRVLVVANGSFLVNEPMVNPARRALAERVADWAGDTPRAVAFVEGAFVLSDAGGAKSLFEMIRDMPELRWAMIHVSLAAVMAALARAPRLGRPRPDPASDADRPAAYARAIGALLARGGSADHARDVLERYRQWRHPRPEAPAPVETLATETLVAASETSRRSAPESPGRNAPHG